MPCKLNRLYTWNQHFSKMKQVVLVACGSAAAWMKQKLLKSKGGLYNRVTRRIKLEPFNLHQTEVFCQQKNFHFSRYQIVQLYMVMGGIPFYLNELSSGKSVTQLIDEICFSSMGLLADEYEQLYHSLFKNATNHIALIEALANHPYGLVRSELLKKSALPDGGTFTRTVSELVESGFILKYQPFQKKEKDSVYRLIDLYSLFYLRFIKEAMATNSNSWQLLSNEPRFIAWSGYAYENVCFSHIPQIKTKLGISGVLTKVFSYVVKPTDDLAGTQIDLIIDRMDHAIHICEIKFSQNMFILDKKTAENIQQKKAIFQYHSKTKKHLFTTFITTFGMTDNKWKTELVDQSLTMDDLFV